MQRATLQMLADGRDYLYIGRQLHRSSKTVSRYVREIHDKLGAISPIHAVAIGFRKHIIV